LDCLSQSLWSVNQLKRFTPMAAMLLISAVFVFGFQVLENPHAGGKKIPFVQPDHEDTYHVTEPKTLDVYLKRIYLGGVVTTDVKSVTIQSMEDFWSRFSKWK